MVSSNHGQADCYIIKLNSVGNVTWQKSFGGSGFEVANSIQQTSDGGYIFAGATDSNDGDVSGKNGLDDAWIVKLDKNGAIVWQKCVSASGTYHVASSMDQTKMEVIL